MEQRRKSSSIQMSGVVKEKTEFKERSSLRQVFSESVAPNNKEEAKRPAKLVMQKNMEVIYSNCQPQTLPVNNKKHILKIGNEIDISVTPDIKIVVNPVAHIISQFPIDELHEDREDENEDYKQPNFGLGAKRLDIV